MKSNAICPISDKKIDENVARLNGVFTVILLVVYLFSNNILPILFLLIDFILRGAELSKYSILANFSKVTLKALKVKTLAINAGPKIFAARIGALFSFLILLFNLLDIPSISVVFTVVFGVCAFLEAAFAFCVACQIYPLVFKFTFQSKITKINI